MERGFFTPLREEDEPRGGFDRRGGRKAKDHLFLWTVLILLLIAFAMATWIGTFSVFGHPERPYAYRILRKIKKIDPPLRYKVTAAPIGKFLGPEDLLTRYSALGDFDLRKANVTLLREYIRNFQSSTTPVQYVMGKFTLIAAFPLGPKDVFPSGAVMYAAANDAPQLLIEFVLPADSATGESLVNALVPGVEVDLRRTYDLSAVIHAARLPDGRIQLTVMPLLYGELTLRKAGDSFSLDPPSELRLQNEWPIVQGPRREKAEKEFTATRARAGFGPLVARVKDAPPPTTEVKAPPDVLTSTDSAPRKSAPKSAAAPAKAASAAQPVKTETKR